MNSTIIFIFILLFFPILIINSFIIIYVLLLPFVILGFIILPKDLFTSILKKVQNKEVNKYSYNLGRIIISIQKEITERFSVFFLKSSEVFIIEKLILRLYLIFFLHPYQQGFSSFLLGMKSVKKMKEPHIISEPKLFLMKLLCVPVYTFMFVFFTASTVYLLWPSIILFLMFY